MARMDLGLRDRVYLVTGGSRGLGFAAAQALVADGARVLLSAPHESTAADAAARLTQDAAHAAAAWTTVDNADPVAPSQLIGTARDRFGRLDGALISVGGSPGETVADTGDDAWRSAFESVFLHPATATARRPCRDMVPAGFRGHQSIASIHAAAADCRAGRRGARMATTQDQSRPRRQP
jgi:3-oxoacyl-[acyl-carrier protein] reductase